MKQVWKFPIPTTDFFSIDMPWGAEILMAQCQHDHPYIWALCDPNRVLKTRHFRMAETDHDIGVVPPVRYIGTFQLRAGALVFHVFEILV